MLNKEFNKLIQENPDIELAYGTMVHNFSYRFLDMFTYSHKPKSIRSNRVASVPIETDEVS